VLLNHVSLTVGDREASAAFYGEHFALTERVHDDEHLLILGAPDGSLLANHLPGGDGGPDRTTIRLPRGDVDGQRLSSSISSSVLSSPSHVTGNCSRPASSSVPPFSLPPLGGSIIRTDSRGQEPRSSGLM
jgi:catechol 2,3-dioxygenase-like lactoylglutathione lyase family enzyme